MESVFNNACYVIGAGVSAAALGPYTPCSSWGNLVEECFSYCKNQNLLSAEQCDEIESNISSLKKPNSNASDAADKLTGIADTLFKSMGKTRFENWIQGICHDGLQIKNYSLLDALIKAPGIILTTNYDLLIEERCSQKSVEYISFTWQDPKAIQYALKRCNKKIIIHIHGSIQKPESIIFTSEQYNELSQSIANDRIFQSIMTAYKLYVVGAGSGLRDLDFSRQFKDFTSIFNVTTSESESYLLCKSDLIEEFRDIANQYSFKLIDFGENYEDLPIYIEKMNSENKFLEKEKELKDLINQDFSNYKEISQVEDAAALIMPMGFCLKNPSDLLESSSTHERLGVSYIEQSSKRVFCLVAEGESGLTTGLREFALDFISDKFYVYLLNKNELDRVDFLSSNCIHPCIFVIDNFALDSVKKFRAFCKKINISNNEDKFLIGCGMKSCEKIATLLQEQDIDSCILYLDKVRKHDIDLCAKAYFPENSFLQKRSSDLVFQTIASMNLPRTYSTVQKLFVYFKKKDLNSVEDLSQSVLLQQYCHATLEIIVDNGEYMQFTIEDLEQILASLAKKMVENKQISLTESETENIISNLSEALGMDFDARKIVNELCNRRILTRKEFNSQYCIYFAHSSYLLLYAAIYINIEKDEDDGSTFYNYLLNDALTFNGILITYSEINSRSIKILKKSLEIYEDAKRKNKELESVMYSSVNIDANVRDDVKLLTDSEASKLNNAHKNLYNQSEEVADEFFHAEVDEDRCAANIYVDSGTLVDSERWAIALHFLSSVLKQSDHISNVKIRIQAIDEALKGWGNYFFLTRSDKSFASIQEKIDGNGGQSSVNGSKNPYSIQEEIAWIFYCTFLYEFLCSKRLYRLIPKNDAALEDGRVPYALSAFLFFLFERGDDWYRKARMILKKESSIFKQESINYFIQQMLTTMYCYPESAFSGPILQKDLLSIRNLYGDIFEYSSLYKNNRESKGVVLNNLDKIKGNFK